MLEGIQSSEPRSNRKGRFGIQRRRQGNSVWKHRRPRVVPQGAEAALGKTRSTREPRRDPGTVNCRRKASSGPVARRGRASRTKRLVGQIRWLTCSVALRAKRADGRRATAFGCRLPTLSTTKSRISEYLVRGTYPYSVRVFRTSTPYGQAFRMSPQTMVVARVRGVPECNRATSPGPPSHEYRGAWTCGMAEAGIQSASIR